jgi:hypothetical protein
MKPPAFGRAQWRALDGATTFIFGRAASTVETGAGEVTPTRYLVTLSCPGESDLPRVGG